MRILLLALLAAAAMGGCVDCKPLLDVRHCMAGSETCRPQEGGLLAEWNETHAADWPDVDRMIRDTNEGDHTHAGWNEAHRIDWWMHWEMDPNATENEVFVEHDGGLYRIRVLRCN